MRESRRVVGAVLGAALLLLCGGVARGDWKDDLLGKLKGWLGAGVASALAEGITIPLGAGVPPPPSPINFTSLKIGLDLAQKQLVVTAPTSVEDIPLCDSQLRVGPQGISLDCEIELFFGAIRGQLYGAADFGSGRWTLRGEVATAVPGIDIPLQDSAFEIDSQAGLTLTATILGVPVTIGPVRSLKGFVEKIIAAVASFPLLAVEKYVGTVVDGAKKVAEAASAAVDGARDLAQKALDALGPIGAALSWVLDQLGKLYCDTVGKTPLGWATDALGISNCKKKKQQLEEERAAKEAAQAQAQADLAKRQAEQKAAEEQQAIAQEKLAAAQCQADAVAFARSVGLVRFYADRESADWAARWQCLPSELQQLAAKAWSAAGRDLCAPYLGRSGDLLCADESRFRQCLARASAAGSSIKVCRLEGRPGSELLSGSACESSSYSYFVCRDDASFKACLALGAKATCEKRGDVGSVLLNAGRCSRVPGTTSDYTCPKRAHFEQCVRLSKLWLMGAPNRCVDPSNASAKLLSGNRCELLGGSQRAYRCWANAFERCLAFTKGPNASAERCELYGDPPSALRSRGVCEIQDVPGTPPRMNEKCHGDKICELRFPKPRAVVCENDGSYASLNRCLELAKDPSHRIGYCSLKGYAPSQLLTRSACTPSEPGRGPMTRGFVCREEAAFQRCLAYARIKRVSFCQRAWDPASSILTGGSCRELRLPSRTGSRFVRGFECDFSLEGQQGFETCLAASRTGRGVGFCQWGAQTATRLLTADRCRSPEAGLRTLVKHYVCKTEEAFHSCLRLARDDGKSGVWSCLLEGVETSDLLMGGHCQFVPGKTDAFVCDADGYKRCLERARGYAKYGDWKIRACHLDGVPGSDLMTGGACTALGPIYKCDSVYGLGRCEAFAASEAGRKVGARCAKGWKDAPPPPPPKPKTYCKPGEKPPAGCVGDVSKCGWIFFCPDADAQASCEMFRRAGLAYVDAEKNIGYTSQPIRACVVK